MNYADICLGFDRGHHVYARKLEVVPCLVSYFTI
jgi:hypothetical protein